MARLPELQGREPQEAGMQGRVMGVDGRHC